MSDLVSAQQEFEELISELEKLKTVNQLTTANAENAAALIKEVESFATKADAYVEKINTGQHEIAQDARKVMQALKDGIEEYRKMVGEFQNTSRENQGFQEAKFSKLTDLLNGNFTGMAEVLRIIKEDQKNAEKGLKADINAVNTAVSDFQTATNTALAQQIKAIKGVKTLLIVILVLMLAGFGGIVYLMMGNG